MSFSSIRQTWYSHLISFCLMVTFVTSMVITPRSSYAGVMGLPQPGAMVDLSSSYAPLMITGLTVHPENPLLMDFIVSTGNSGLNADQVKKESDRLIKYFLACLTIPESNQWVNLSPYEKQRIIPEDLGQTVLGRDMLAQDYLLKQLTASLIYPEKNLGRNFWDKVYTQAQARFNTTQIPVNTFNKVWILPDTAKIYEHKTSVFVVKSHLKVMLDEDYLALSRHSEGVQSTTEESKGTLRSFANAQDDKSINTLGNKIVHQIILPAIEEEVNKGKNFAQLRQIYNSMILAVWFKKNLKQTLLNQVYTDKSKINGVNVDDPSIKEKIYHQYIEAYKKGVFNYIKEETDPISQETIPRKYFSGGLTPFDAAMLKPATVNETVTAFSRMPGDTFRVSGFTQEANPNAAMTSPTGWVFVSEAPRNAEGTVRTLTFKRGEQQRSIVLQLTQEGNERIVHAIVRGQILPVSRPELFEAPPARIIEYMERAAPSIFNPAMTALDKGRETLKSIQTNIERGYNVRGIAIGPKATMTTETLYAVGVGLGLELNDRFKGRRSKVLVTGDQRSTTPALRQASSEGLAFQGIDVDFSKELISTPAANVIARLPGSGYDAVLQITASHNPGTIYIASEGNKKHDPENGFKINIRQQDGQFRGIYGRGMMDLLSRSFSAEAEKSNPHPGEIKEVEVMDRYYDHLAELFKKNLTFLGLSLEQAQKELVLVVDTGNGVMGPVAKAVIQGRLGIQYVGIDDEVISDINGIPAHEADPSKRPIYAQRFTEEVRKVSQRLENQDKIVIGLAFDGDGDRIGMTDENGSQYLTLNQQGYFFFSRMKETNPNSAVILDIRMGQEIMEELGLNAKEAKWHAPGGAVVRKTMQEAGADVAIEGSHHTMLRQFDDRNTDAIDDGLYAGLFAAIQSLKLKTEGRSIHQLLDRTWYPSLVEELRPAVAESTLEERYELMPQIAESLSNEVASKYQGAQILRIPSPGERGAVRLQISHSDGSFIGWILMRASNTSSRLSMQAQGKDKQTIAQLATIIGDVLSKFDKVNQAEVKIVLAKTLSDAAELSVYAQDDEMSLNREPTQRIISHRINNAMSPGGIDLNSRNLYMQTQGEKVNITFDPAMIAQFKRGDFSGVQIKILDVVPVNLIPLLGLKEE